MFLYEKFHQISTSVNLDFFLHFIIKYFPASYLMRCKSLFVYLSILEIGGGEQHWLPAQLLLFKLFLTEQRGTSRMNRTFSPSLVRPTLPLRRPSSGPGLVTPSSLNPVINNQGTYLPQEWSLVTGSSDGILKTVVKFVQCSF